jgi:phosphatidylserine/phosphatidylglycerophosphate/cardiolipin synthase-like enzyme
MSLDPGEVIMVSRELIAALKHARSKMSGDTWQQVVMQVARFEGSPIPESIRRATDGILSRDAAWILTEAFERSTQTTWREIASAMTTVDFLVGDSAPLTEIIWTGPANDRFPVRRIDQVLYDLISNAKKRIVLVTFAAHRVPHLCAHLRQAVERGVALTLIVESEEESEGQLTKDAVAAFQNVPLAGTRIYYWPIEKRERNQAGRPGKLHTKCAIIDNIALIGSANLTDDAFNRNMELGMLVREEATVLALTEHFRELVSLGILVEVRQEEP